MKMSMNYICPNYSCTITNTVLMKIYRYFTVTWQICQWQPEVSRQLVEQKRRRAAAGSRHCCQEAQHAVDQGGGGPVAAAGRHGGQQQLQHRLLVQLTLPRRLAWKPEGRQIQTQTITGPLRVVKSGG